MPELPDLEVIRDTLDPRLRGVAITATRVRRSLVMRSLLGGDFGEHLAGRRFQGVRRRGKFLLLDLDDGAALVINPMLAGRLRYGPPLKRDRARDALIIDLADGNELRYNDAVDMGKIYLTRDVSQVPTFADLGPEATDAALTSEVFAQRLAKQSGEIKDVLTRQTFIAGIGNAYADEILWHAQISPFRKRAELAADERERLYESMRAVLAQAIATLRDRMGDDIDVEVRDFLAVHGRAGRPCPRCGHPISEVTRERRATNFCRTCQPGLLVDRR